MKNSAVAILLCVVLGSSLNAQKFTLLPQSGLETSKTFFRYNSLESFAPRALQLAPRLGLRMDYAFKQSHGPYVGIATSRSSVAMDITEPESAMNITNVSVGPLQLRMEAGYQFNSKPIYFKKAPTKTVAKPAVQQPGYKSRCGNYCTGYRSFKALPPATSTPDGTSNSWYVSIQPSAGVAYLPAIKTDITTESTGGKTSITYLAGNMSTALVTGVNFEFGTNIQRKFNLGIQYFKGMGNLETETIATSSGNKPSVTSLGSSVSGWSMSLGIPISVAKKKTVVKQAPVIEEKKSKTERSRCGQYYSRFTKSVYL